MLIFVKVQFEAKILEIFDWEKSDVLMYEIAPHSKEFASFRRQAWSNLIPGGCGTFHWEVTSAYLYAVWT